MTAASSPVPPDAAGGRHQRHAKNYLIDRRFQLKYSGFLVGITLLLSVALGVLLWNTSSEAVEEGRLTVQQGQATVSRGKEVVVQSRKVNEVVKMTIRQDYKDDPEVGNTFGELTADDETRLLTEQAKLEQDASVLQQREQDLESQQRRLLEGLVVGLALLVLGVGAAGIVFTHKVAGPIFKMKRLLREVGEGKLVVREHLRKGDELQHFFEAFEKMVNDMRAHQEGEIAKVGEILGRLERAPVSQRNTRELEEDGMTLLRKLHREMQEKLEA